MEAIHEVSDMTLLGRETEINRLAATGFQNLSPRQSVRPRVLIVDDNEDYADICSALLRSQGYWTEIAYDGSTAIQRASEGPIDVVLLDIGLPDMSGLNVASALRDMGCLARLVAVTAWDDAAMRESIQARGFCMHLTKPVDIERIVAAIGEKA